jgi:hypothetical protein
LIYICSNLSTGQNQNKRINDNDSISEESFEMSVLDDSKSNMSKSSDNESSMSEESTGIESDYEEYYEKPKKIQRSNHHHKPNEIDTLDPKFLEFIRYMRRQGSDDGSKKSIKVEENVNGDAYLYLLGCREFLDSPIHSTSSIGFREILGTQYYADNWSKVLNQEKKQI